MADHPVKLHYTQSSNPAEKPLFRPQPRQIFVKAGQTIAFQKANDSVPGTIHITFQDPEFFSVPDTDGSSDVLVTGTPTPTTYHCQLRGPNGQALADSSEDPEGGGEILPDPPPSA